MMQKLKNVKLNKKGFTLAELLIVVAIIAVLVAIAIPVFSSSLSKARDAVTEANERAAKSAAMVDYLESMSDGSDPEPSGTITQDENGTSVTYNWTYADGIMTVTKVSSSQE